MKRYPFWPLCVVVDMAILNLLLFKVFVILEYHWYLFAAIPAMLIYLSVGIIIWPLLAEHD